MFLGLGSGMSSPVVSLKQLGQHTCHHEWSLLARGELVHFFTVEDASEHAVAHLECPLTDETLVVLGDGPLILP
jgi:hypothetical protein